MSCGKAAPSAEALAKITAEGPKVDGNEIIEQACNEMRAARARAKASVAADADVTGWVGVGGEALEYEGDDDADDADDADDGLIVFEGGCGLLELKGFRWKNLVCDSMHTIGNLMRVTVLMTLLAPRWSTKVASAEKQLNRWGDGPPGKLNDEEKGVLFDVFKDMALSLGGKEGMGRLNTLHRPGSSTKTHTLFLLAGPVGLYALAKVLSKVKPKSAKGTIILVLMQLVRAMHLLWLKEVPADSLATLKAVVVEAVCAVEAVLPMTERDMKLHQLARVRVRPR